MLREQIKVEQVERLWESRRDRLMLVNVVHDDPHQVQLAHLLEILQQFEERWLTSLADNWQQLLVELLLVQLHVFLFDDFVQFFVFCLQLLDYPICLLALQLDLVHGVRQLL